MTRRTTGFRLSALTSRELGGGEAGLADDGCEGAALDDAVHRHDHGPPVGARADMQPYYPSRGGSRAVLWVCGFGRSGAGFKPADSAKPAAKPAARQRRSECVLSVACGFAGLFSDPKKGEEVVVHAGLAHAERRTEVRAVGERAAEVRTGRLESLTEAMNGPARGGTTPADAAASRRA